LGAAVLAAHLDMPLNQASQKSFQHYQGSMQSSGLLAGFLHSAHGRKLVQLGFADDIRLCAQVDLITDVVPILTAVVPLPCGGQGVQVRRGTMQHATPL